LLGGKGEEWTTYLPLTKELFQFRGRSEWKGREPGEKSSKVTADAREGRRPGRTAKLCVREGRKKKADQGRRACWNVGRGGGEKLWRDLAGLAVVEKKARRFRYYQNTTGGGKRGEWLPCILEKRKGREKKRHFLHCGGKRGRKQHFNRRKKK